MDIKKSLKKSFNNRKFKYGGYAVLITAIVVSIVIVINLLLGYKEVKFDLTTNKKFSLSQQSFKIIDNLKQNVTITGLYQSGKENATVKEILEKYQKRSKKITVEYKDPNLNPQMSEQYNKNGTSNISEGNIIVKSGEKYKIISSSNLVNYNQSSGTVESYAIEQNITGAILYVTSENNFTVYNLTSENEGDIPTAYQNSIQNDNYVIKNTDLSKDELKNPADSILMVVSPKRDITKDELNKLKDYFSKGGKGIFMFDLMSTDIPNFNELLNSFGLNIPRAVVVDADSNHNLNNNPLYAVPTIESHDITNAISSQKLPIVVPAAQPILKAKISKQSLKIEPLLTTSSNSWAKTNMQTTTLQKEKDDLAGPFDLAEAVTDGDTNSKIVAIGTSKITDSSISTSSTGNIDFVTNSFNWLQGSKQNISIRAKDATTNYVSMTSMQQIIYSALVVIFIPAAIFIIGAVIWSRRKNL